MSPRQWPTVLAGHAVVDIGSLLDQSLPPALPKPNPQWERVHARGFWGSAVCTSTQRSLHAHIAAMGTR